MKYNKKISLITLKKSFNNIFRIMYILILFLSFTAISFALDNSYKLKDLELNISFPDEWIVITKDNYMENPKLKELDITEEYMENFFATSKAYLDAAKDNLEIFIRSIDSDLNNNLSDRNNSDIGEFAQALIDKTGANDYEILENNDIKYVKSNYIDKSYGYDIIEYVTVVNNKNITITVQNLTSVSTDEQKNEIERIVKSIKFDRIIDYSNSFYKDVLEGALIGGTVGGVVGLIGYFIDKSIKKKKNLVEKN